MLFRSIFWPGQNGARGAVGLEFIHQALQILLQILAGMEQIAEGVPTTKAAFALAGRYQVDMPITAQLHAVLFEGVSPSQAVTRLMSRPGKEETESWGALP